MEGILSTYLENLQKAQEAMNKAKAVYDKYIVDTQGAESWYNHLVSIAAWNTHPVEWAASKAEFEGRIAPQRQIYLAAYNLAKANYETAKAEYDDAKDNLVSPQEIASHEAELQAQAQVAQAQAQLTAQQTASRISEEEQEALKKRIINYIVIGVIVIAVGLLAWWGYKKYFKK